MINEIIKRDLKKQHYYIVGNHSATKICGWTGKMLRNEGACYKHKFYGIKSNQCLQMSTCLSCANNCVICWRSNQIPNVKGWKGEVDNPEKIFKESLEAQKKLLSGFGGYKEINKKFLEEAREVRHVALSLIGEPILYPKINDFIKILKENKISIFLVTNGQYPEQIKNLDKITQLYLSLDASNEELLKEIDKPLFKDFWKRLERSLEYLKGRKDRTCIRLTCIKGINMSDMKDYAELIKKGDPDFVEVKGYMFIGSSRERLEEKNMPLHEDVVEFSKILCKELEDYEIVSEHILSRVVLLAKKSYKKKGKWFTWIDFNSGNELETPEVGLSGKGTLS
ncbi:MAG: 4-demethylwyosine synthase TYW1 [Nanoarchaeota archaeon]|jgi:tRNA wybutosine-synthesizing protein 1|nr:4-demethylwyosine synthase TYW1 [Nanoarchaeota archaeon]|tara:strand:+ start:30710 stop:31723 length:1014 start_codon:yes stop_codon:yes gene_type:complete